jgi:hypothetical protein
VLWIFIALKNPLPWPSFEPIIFGSSGQHTNHYTTKGTSYISQACLSSSKFILLHLANLVTLCRSWGSSVSTVSDYKLDDRAIGVRSLARADDFSSNFVCAERFWAHLASCPMGTEGPFLGVKSRPGGDADHSPPSSAEVMNELELYSSSPKRLHGVLWDRFTLLTLCEE